MSGDGRLSTRSSTFDRCERRLHSRCSTAVPHEWPPPCRRPPARDVQDLHGESLGGLATSGLRRTGEGIGLLPLKFRHLSCTPIEGWNQHPKLREVWSQVFTFGVPVFARYALQDRLQPVEAELAVVSAFHPRAASLESHVIALKSVHGASVRCVASYKPLAIRREPQARGATDRESQ